MVDFTAIATQQLEPFAGSVIGNPLGTVVAVKGEGGRGFSADESVALDKAFVALDWGDGAWCGVLLRAEGVPALDAAALRLVIEVVDPLVVVALDEAARRVLVDAFTGAETGFPVDVAPGRSVYCAGRLLVSVDGFEASLDDEARKQRAWAQFKQCRRPRVM
ncbi:MAG: hypothetical protein LBS58_03450 [Coriobacteriales bacterium]|jgi:hypothetical protein|nr:hypothetical protein [Coriobacteriales bacterium]